MEHSNEFVYCNNCGTANPPRTAICCTCGHVHAITVQRGSPVQRVEKWFWVVLRIVCGIALCVGGAVPTSGVTLNTAVLAAVAASIAIPVAIASVIALDDWLRWSRWFVGAAVAEQIARYGSTVVGRIHFR